MSAPSPRSQNLLSVTEKQLFRSVLPKTPCPYRGMETHLFRESNLLPDTIVADICIYRIGSDVTQTFFVVFPENADIPIYLKGLFNVLTPYSYNKDMYYPHKRPKPPILIIIIIIAFLSHDFKIFLPFNPFLTRFCKLKQKKLKGES